jgi:hypothetical protein
LYIACIQHFLHCSWFTEEAERARETDESEEPVSAREMVAEYNKLFKLSLAETMQAGRPLFDAPHCHTMLFYKVCQVFSIAAVRVPYMVPIRLQT